MITCFAKRYKHAFLINDTFYMALTNMHVTYPFKCPSITFVSFMKCKAAVFETTKDE